MISLDRNRCPVWAGIRIHHASAVLSATEAAERLASEKKLEQARGDFAKQETRATKVKRRVSGVTRPPQAEV